MEMVRSGEAPSSRPFVATFPLRGGRRAAQCAAPTGKTNCLYNRPFPPSVTLCVTPVPIPSGLWPSSLPLLAYGHLPLIGGIGPLIRESSSPTGFKKRFRVWVGEPLGAPARIAPGALARQRQARLWKRCTCNFCKPRARWPGRTRGPPLRFCAPEIFCPAQGITPVMGAGESSPMDLGEAKRSRSPSAASPAAFW